jgi:L-alanine-DL-glutamate epimerase-like enolase superfamily enzyme
VVANGSAHGDNAALPFPMKIVAVHAYTIRHKTKHMFVWRQGLIGSDPESEETWLRLVTDEGVEGWSRTPRGGIAMDLAVRRLKPWLLGKDPLMKERLWHELWEIDRIEEFPMYIMGWVDTALWDITAKVAKLPLYQLLGGYRHEIEAYASTVTYATTEEFLDVADQCLARGFRAIKLHAWGDARKDAALCTALRRHVGPDVALMYDGSAGFDPYESLYLGRALEAAGYLWYEEPMREFSIGAYRRLCEQLDIPVLAAETSDGCHYNVADFIAQGAADMVRTSYFYKGGITGALRVAHLADSFQLSAEVHGMGVENTHLCLAIRNNHYYESLVMGNPVVFEPCIGQDGMVRAPTAPGVGYDVSLKAMQRAAVAKL